MYRIIITILIAITSVVLGLFTPVFADPVQIPGSDTLSETSISVTVDDSDPSEMILEGGLVIFGFLKTFISGIALIYLVIIGAFMVMYSENEERIKSQRKQIIYAMVGLVFLNIPGTLYSTFFLNESGGRDIVPTGNWSDIDTTLFWNMEAFGTSDNLLFRFIALLKMFIFGVAILMFTWGLFRMIISAGDEESRKQGRNRLLYGTLGLIFIGFIEGWGALIAGGDFEEIASTGNQLLGIALYFSGPIAIFFLIWGSYYYITSGGDEERVKKGKAIIFNTFIASLILLASFSFMQDLIKFTLD